MSGNSCYCEKCRSHHHPMDECSPVPDVLTQPWYLLEQPWCHSNDAGTTILAGDIDPHRATFVCDLQPVWDDEGAMDVDTARQVAEHIVRLHNTRLKKELEGTGTPPA